MMIFAIILVYLIFCTYTDISSGKINLPLSLAFSAAGIILLFLSDSYPENLLPAAAGLCPGILFLLLSRFTKGAVGLGDGIMLITIGCFFPLMHSICFLFYGLLISAAASLFLMVFKKRPGKSRLPFAPFLLSGYVAFYLLFFAL